MLNLIVGRVFKLGIASYILILVILAISNFSLFSVNWPYGLVASFTVYLFGVAPIMLLISLMVWKKSLPLLGFTAVIAFYPLASFNKFERPNFQKCDQKACLSIVSINLHHDLSVMSRLSELPEVFSADLILLQDLPYDFSKEKIADVFGQNKFIRMWERTETGEPLGSAIAVVSRASNISPVLLEDGLENTHFNLRGLVKFSIEDVFDTPLDVFVVHPMMPLGREGMVYRDQLLDRTISEIGNSNRFVLVGDLNLTPWEPKFHELPGKRAGDPRWISTWDSRKPWLRLAIDHFLIGSDLEPVQSKVLSSVGSDHYPIYTIVRERTD